MRVADYDAMVACGDGPVGFALVDAWWRACCRTFDTLVRLGFSRCEATLLALGSERGAP